MKIINSSDSDIFIWRKNNIAEVREQFYKKLNPIKGTEYERFCRRIVGIVFDYGYNITEIYDKYFAVEYNTLGNFLCLEMGMTEESASVVMSSMGKNESLWYENVSLYEGYSFSNMFATYWEDDELIHELNSLLEELND